MPGRKPKPTAIKRITGNPGKRPLNHNEPQPEVVLLPCPKELVGAACEEWNRIAPELTRIGLLTRVDEKALASYCQAWAQWVDAIENVRKYGAVIKTPKGYPIQNPYLGIANTSSEIMRKTAVEFGMTPSARSRVSAITLDGKIEDPWAELETKPTAVV